MALPIVHAAAGYVIQRHDRTLGRGLWPCALAVLVANLPDFDFLVGFVAGKPGMFHRGFSHTVLAAVLFGVLAGICYRRLARASWLRATLVFTAIYLSHFLLDALTVDARAPHGAQFLWPLSDAYIISPVTIFGEIVVDGSGRAPFLHSIFNAAALAVLVREAALSAAIIAALALVEGAYRRRREEGGALAEEALPGAVGEYEMVLVEAQVQGHGEGGRSRRLEGS